MQNSRLDESKAAIKIARRNINNITYADLLLFISTTSEMQLLSQVPNFSSPWTAARQASLSFTISWSLLKLMSTEPVMFPLESTSLRAGSESCLSFYPSGFY